MSSRVDAIEHEAVSMKITKRIVMRQFLLAVIMVAFMSIAYIFVMPTFFGGRPTYSVLIAGLSITAVGSGAISRV